MPDILQRSFKADKPNKKWSTDITEFSLFGRKLYLSPIIDLYNGEIISYKVSERPVLKQVTDMVKEAVEAGADIIMLDNMSTEEMQEAIRIIDGRAETECSGNITKENIKTITSLGVDYVSSGALTHSAPILDISLKHLRVLEG